MSSQGFTLFQYLPVITACKCFALYPDPHHPIYSNEGKNPWNITGQQSAKFVLV